MQQNSERDVPVNVKIGTVVYHKSNENIKMTTISEPDEDDEEVECRWVDKNGKTQVQAFLIAELQLWKPGSFA